jgi:hypothetical protein
MLIAGAIVVITPRGPGTTNARSDLRAVERLADLRGGFASRLILEASTCSRSRPQPGHKPSTCLDIDGRLFEEFDPSKAVPGRRDDPRGQKGHPSRRIAH